MSSWRVAQIVNHRDNFILNKKFKAFVSFDKIMARYY
jgi:hypothetical protein